MVKEKDLPCENMSCSYLDKETMLCSFLTRDDAWKRNVICGERIVDGVKVRE